MADLENADNITDLQRLGDYLNENRLEYHPLFLYDIGEDIKLLTGLFV